MLNLETKELEQTQLKEYLLGLKQKLLDSKKKKNSEGGDHLMYNKRIHHFADQFLQSKGHKIPTVSLLIDKATVEEFIASSNADFRQKYSKQRALTVHQDKRVSMPRRF